MNQPLVEIVIPVYNGAQHLRECLESVLAQTYQSWKATIVNNCSTDDTGEIAEEFVQRDPRFRVVHCRDFVGQAANYTRAVAQTSEGTAYVKVLEADNWITEDSVQRMVELAEQDPEIGIVGSYYCSARRSGFRGRLQHHVMSGQQLLVFTSRVFTSLEHQAHFWCDERRFASCQCGSEMMSHMMTLICAFGSLPSGSSVSSAGFSRLLGMTTSVRTARYVISVFPKQQGISCFGSHGRPVLGRCGIAHHGAGVGCVSYYRTLGHELVRGRLTKAYWRFQRDSFAAQS